MKESDLNTYINYMARKKANPDYNAIEEEEIALSNINGEIIKGNRELLRALNFIDVAPDLTQKLLIAEEYMKSYHPKQEVSSDMDKTMVFATPEEIQQEIKEDKLQKAKKKALVMQNKGDYGFSYVVVLTIIVTVLFFALIYFTLN